MLDKYRDKRNFEVTSEPAPEQPVAFAQSLTFVVQKHAARRLHYDLRLESEGALKSWAVPKGPSLRPADKHLAVHVEDHPLSYASFEGVIPKGEYGGGEVIVWDRGVYAAMTEEKKIVWDRDEADRMIQAGIEKGHVKFWLEGEKLRGGWVLIKTKRGEDWLLIKENDEGVADRDVLADEGSVLSGRTTEDLRKRQILKTYTIPADAVEGPMPSGLLPMKLNEVDKPFTDPKWAFELKLDGIRALAIIENGKVCLRSRNDNDITRKFPALVQELEAIGPPNCVLDGEVVLFDENGRPSFQTLIQRFSLQSDFDIRQVDLRMHVDFILFDVLYLDKSDLRKCKFSDRRHLLEEIGMRGRHTRIIDLYPEVGELLYEQARNLGLEGVVGKRLDSTYHSGERSNAWVKVKGSHTEEFLVGGYTEGQGSRSSTFGALLVGQFDEQGKLIFCGSVGGGFSDEELDKLKPKLEAMRTKESPFANKVELKTGKPIYLKPEWWIEVRFANWTDDHKLRAPTFLRFRDDLRIDAPHLTAEVPVGSRAEVRDEPSKKPAPPAINNQQPTADLVERIRTAKDEKPLEVDGESFKLSSLGKVFWPESELGPAVTKRDYLVYLARVAEPFLKALKDRPLSLVRYPSGIEGEGFFQKHVDKGTPDFVEKVRLWSSHNNRAVEFTLCNNRATLLWMAQNAVLEIHPFYSRIVTGPDAPDTPTDFATSEDTLDESILNYPDFVVIDLDPNLRSGKERDGAEPEMNHPAWDMAVKVAKRTRQILLDIGLKAFLKTSGKTGLHLYVPIVRHYDYNTVRLIAETLGKHVMKEMPNEVTMEWVVKKRPEKVFFDHNQNVRGKTLVSAYSTRAVQGATVSMPLRWEELDDVYPAQFTHLTVPDFLARRPDPWADILSTRQRIA